MTKEILLYNYLSPLGNICFELRAGELVTLHFQETRPESNARSIGDDLLAQEIVQWLDAYFSGKRPDWRLIPLGLKGTSYQQTVWESMLEIPYGRTITYGDLATQIGSGARAVGGAVGRNPVCIIAPCHRVVGASGKLVGYAEGLERKRWLLAHECGRTG